jgi:ribosome biogenesis GTPase / thiamine phosphate phosphatase
MPKAIVVKSTGSWYRVLTPEGDYLDCKLKGNFRIKGIKSTNPIAVGDYVFFEDSEKHKVPLITQIESRRNHIIRKATKLSKRSHIIAANIDYAYVVVSLKEPKTTTGFIDRFLSTAEVYHIPASIVFNKIDIYGAEEMQELKELSIVYESLGYPCFHLSALKGTNIEEIKEKLKNKTTLFSGHSGVGKSALINAIDKNLDIKTGEISDYHKKGKHTTTYAELFPLEFGGFIIDTPGIKEFALFDFTAEELAQSFPEMRQRMHNCKYTNCLHLQEPDCAVKEAVETGEIAASRYKNYLKMIADIEPIDYDNIK